ncbi:thioredoxin domain-containing protein [Haloarchaeobius sp. DYHT-AS-18]|uniref:thioredoxin domain-containing protein n=1 Tax=Haloarchaeobius sp. DYHT-AS-18 TaxID=3446117 RepID=UPI003EBB07CF
MSDPTARNRLDEEASPYLRQHADNPVNWQPWDDAALSAAREEDKPIFLSVGYSACHWCHVMEDESFEDDDVAEVLNEHFVPIKVDREERPDLDSIYQTVCQAVSGRGGWPLSVWLTPEGKPFYVGTYFPREPRRNMPGFLSLLENVAESWQDPEQRKEMANRADQWTRVAKDQLEDVESPGEEAPGEDVLSDAATSLMRSVDREYGGFGNSGPKFPQEARLHVLLRSYDRSGRDGFREAVAQNLDAMGDGGLYDHVGGGFHRYCTDRDWTVPHFEKMLYDNAELSRIFLAGYQATGEETYRDRVEETLDFVTRELQHDGGGFFSTLDAQSANEEGEQEEGAFYVWTPEQVQAVLDDEDSELFCERYGVTSKGNFENGQTVLTISASIADLAEEHDLAEAEVEARLADAKQSVFEAREERPRPRRDDKVLAGWNGLMISAFAEAAIVLDEGYAAPAEEALDFVREHLWDADAGRLTRRFADGDVKGEGYLEDYAFLARGAFDLYQATGDHESLQFALDLARTIENEFWDSEEETVFFTPAGGEDLVARPQELRDQSTPSSLGVTLDVFLSLSHFSPDDEFETVVESVLATHGGRIESSPLEYPSLVLAADRWNTGDRELTVAADELPEDWRAAIGDTYLPARVLALRPPTADGLDAWLGDLDFDTAPPIWADRDATDGEPTVYACRDFSCSPPTHDIAEALDWLGDETGN